MGPKIIFNFEKNEKLISLLVSAPQIPKFGVVDHRISTRTIACERMPRKPKQVVQFERTRDAITIDLNTNAWKWFSYYSVEATDSIGALKFLNALALGSNLTDQIKIVQANKGSIRSNLAKEVEVDSNNSVFGVKILLTLYILPEFLAIKNHLEWIVEAILKCKCLTSTLLKKTLNGAFTSILNNGFNKDDYNLFVTSSVANGMGWIFAINSMILFDKDVLWLDHDNVDEKKMSVVDMMDLFVVLFMYSVENIVKTSVDSLCKDSVIAGDVSEKIRFVELAGEVVRGIILMFKHRKNFYITPGLGDRLGEIINTFIVNGCAILTCEFLNKDIIMQISLALVTLQSICKSVDCALNKRDDSKIKATVLLCLLSSNNKYPELYPLLYSLGIKSGLNENFVATCTTFSAEIKGCIFRSVISVFDDISLMHAPLTCYSGSNNLEIVQMCCAYIKIYDVSKHAASSSIFITAIIQEVSILLNNSSSNIQFTALQIIEAWLNRLLSLNLAEYFLNFDMISELIDKLKYISGALLPFWSHPAKIIYHMAPSIYESLLKMVKKMVDEKIINRDLSASLWGYFISESLSLSVLSKGLYHNVSLLLQNVRVDFLLEVKPNLIEILVSSMKYREICSAAGGCFGNILRSVKKNHDDFSFRAFWLNHIVNALCSTCNLIRLHTSNYLLPEISAIDPKCWLVLIKSIRSLTIDNFTVKLSALINVYFQFNLSCVELITFKTEFFDETEYKQCMLSTSELLLSCICIDSDIRFTALNAIVVAKSSKPVNDEELILLRKVLHYFIKSDDSENRNRMVRAIKSLLYRVLDVAEGCHRNISRLNKKLEFIKDSMRDVIDLTELKLSEDKYGDVCVEIEHIKSLSVNTCATIQLICQEIEINLHPGVTCDRELVAIEILKCVINVLKEYGSEYNHLIFTKSMTNAVLNMFLSYWDKSRRIAAELLLEFPVPLNSYDSISSVNKLMEWGVLLATSARQRESEAGALLLKDLFKIYIIELRWKEVILGPSIVLNSTIVNIESVPIGFLNQLCTLLETKLDILDNIFASFNLFTIDIPSIKVETFCHGLIMALRYCIEECVNSKLLEVKSCTTVITIWKQLFQRVQKISSFALSTGMRIVAESPFDSTFAPLVHKIDTDTISEAVSMAASYVNTNSIVVPGFEDISNADDFQRVVVASWLIVKESTALMATLVKISPPETSVVYDSPFVSTNTTIPILSNETIGAIGYTVLDSLGRLKHMGAIAEAQNALRIIAETMIKHGEQCKELCKLPKLWLDDLLCRLVNEKQIFILRRSAGFAFSFIAILRAEPSNLKSILLQLTMSKLLKCIENGIGDSFPVMQNKLYDNSDVGKISWRVSVHAMNVLKLILIDSTLGTDIDNYISDSLKMVVKGLGSPIWAVRNSSMMVFTSIIQSAVNNDKNDSESGIAKSITAYEFFRRFPQIYPFLLETLAVITNHIVNVNNSGWPISISTRSVDDVNSEVIDPSLFPILLLLSKIKVPYDYDVHKCLPSIDLTLFAPLILSCHSSRVYHIREVAAKALVSLTTFLNFSDIIESIINRLIQPIKFETLTCNCVHGLLSILYEFLKQIIQKSSVSNQDALGKNVIVKFESSFIGILEQFMCSNCPPILNLLLKISQYLTIIVSSQEMKDTHDRLCTNIYVNLIDNKTIFSIDKLPKLPGGSLLLKLAVEEQFKILVEKYVSTNDERLFNQLQLLIAMSNHFLSEIRESILISCRNLIMPSPFLESLFDKLNVVEMILDRIFYETEMLMLELALEIFLEIIKKGLPYEVGDILHKSWFELWSKLFKLVKNSQTNSIYLTTCAARAIELSGWIVGKYFALDKSCDEGLIKSHLEPWILLLYEISQEDQPTHLRESASSAIANSTILISVQKSIENKDVVHLSNYGSHLYVQLWLIVIILLQDDDEDIRNDTNMTVLQLFKLFPKQEIIDTTIFSFPDGFQPIQEYIIDHIQYYIADVLLYELKCYDSLNTLDCDYRLPTGITNFLQYSTNIGIGFEKAFDIIHSNKEDNADKIFETEISNLYIECLKSADITFYAIVSCIKDYDRTLNDIKVKCIILKLLERANRAVDIIQEALIHFTWIGGALMHKELYTEIYVSLRAIVILIQNLEVSYLTDEHFIRLKVRCVTLLSSKREEIHSVIVNLLTHICDY